MRSVIVNSVAIIATLFAGLTAAFLTSSEDSLPKGVVSPTMWPARTQYRQAQYNTILKTKFDTMTYYDGPANQMRDVTEANPNTDGSFWNGTTLWIFNSIGAFESCEKLDMGFGVPVQDWFLTNSTTHGTLYQSHKYTALDTDYHKTLWTRKYSVGSVCPDCGPHFNYFSVAKTGQGFKLEAPSPFAEMVNELSEWVNLSASGAPFPEGIMGLPSGVNVSACHASPGQTVHDYLAKLSAKADTVGLKDDEKKAFHLAHNAYAIALAGGRKASQLL